MTEDTYPVLLVGGVPYPQSDMGDSKPPVNDGVWMSPSLLNTCKSEVPPEDPEWIRRRVVAVEQQQWNNYLAASAKAGQLVSHFEPLILPNFSACHIQSKQCSSVSVPASLSQQDSINLNGDAVAGSVGSSPCSSLVASSLSSVKSQSYSFKERDCDPIGSSSIGDPEHHDYTCPSSPPPPVDSANLGEPNDVVLETVTELQPPFVKWILVPQEFASDFEPAVQLLPTLGPVLSEEDSDSVNVKSSHSSEPRDQRKPCPDFKLQRWHF